VGDDLCTLTVPSLEDGNNQRPVGLSTMTPLKSAMKSLCEKQALETPAKLSTTTPCKAAKSNTPWRTPSKNTGNKQYIFDRVFPTTTSQEDMFAFVKDTVGSVVSGYNATIFAYGNTGSGKTHTIMGTPTDEGILSRAVKCIFELIEKAPSTLFTVEMTYVELYNNDFRDLLTPPTDMQSLNPTKVKIVIHDSEARGVYLEGSPHLRTPVTTATQAMELVQRGLQSRAVGSTNLNEHSSRSHAILTLHVESRQSCDGAAVRIGKLHIVDLAGSERVSKSGVTDVALKETQAINLSLTSLGNVLSALSSPRDDMWLIPYRDSKLTHILKDSLGGNAQTVMLTHIIDSQDNYRHALMSLQYSARARLIKNSNQVTVLGLDSDSVLQEKLREIELLKTDLSKREDELASLQCSKDAASAENIELRQELEKLIKMMEVDKENMRSKLAVAQQYADPHLYQRVQELSEHASKYAAEKETLELKLEESRLKEATQAQLHGKAHNEFQQEKAKLEEALQYIINSKSSEILHTQLKMTNLQSKLDEKCQEERTLRISLVSKDDDLDEMTTKLIILKDTVSELEGQRKSLRDRIQVLVEDLSRREKMYTDLLQSKDARAFSEGTEVAKERDHAKRLVSTLQSQLEEKQTQLEDLKKTSSETISALNVDCKAANRKVLKLTEELNAVKAAAAEACEG
jgi:hypothetical protein